MRSGLSAISEEIRSIRGCMCSMQYVFSIIIIVRLSLTHEASDWNGGAAHIDMWIGSTTSNGGQDVVNCENSLTPDQGQAVIRNPASDLPVNCALLRFTC